MINKILELLPKNKYVNLGLLISLIIYQIIASINFPIHDFSNYYFGAKLLVQGEFTNNIYFPEWFNIRIQEFGLYHNFSSFAPNTPFLALVFLPFSYLDPYTAKFLFQVLSGFLFIYSLLKIHAIHQFDTRWFLFLPILFYIPIRNEILFGQVYFFVFFLLTETYIAWIQEKKIKSALFFSISVLFKLSPIYLIFLFLIRKEWKLIFYIGIFSLLLLTLSIIIVGIDVWLFYLTQVLPKASKGEIANYIVDNYQSIGMFLKRIFIYHESENINPIYNNPSLYEALNTSFKLFILILGIKFTLNEKTKIISFSFWILFSFLASPYGSTYSLILILFTLIALAKNLNYKLLAYCIVLFLVCNIPINILLTFDFPLNYLRLYLLITLFGIFTLHFVSIKSFLYITISISILFFYIIFTHKTSNTSRQMLPFDGPLLITKLDVSKNKLAYVFYNQFGFHYSYTEDQFVSVKKLDIINQQIYIDGKIIKSDDSFKKDAWLVDNYMIIYLSDKNRGIGFYTLRMLILDNE